MRRKERYKRGDHWIISDITGQKIRRSEAVVDWRGYVMEKEEYSPKEKQLDIRPRNEKISVNLVRTQNIDESLADPPFDPSSNAI